MKYILSLVLATFIFSTSYAQTKEVIDKVVAIVGNEFILLSDIEEQHAAIQAEQGVAPENLRCMIVENLMGTKLLLNQAKLDSIEVDDTEVESQLDARVEQILGYMNGSVEQFEEYYGQNITEVKNRFRDDLRNQLLVQRMQQGLMTDVSITPADVKSFFDRIPYDSLPYFNSEVELREIIVKPEKNKEEIEKARMKLTDIRERIINGGEDFADLARKNSADLGSAQAGGDLGFQKRGTFVSEFEAAAYSLEENEISELVETDYGFHLIQLLKRRGNSIHTRHILIQVEITEDDLNKTVDKLNDVRELILTDSLTFLKAVKKYSYDEMPSYNTGGRMVNFKTGDTFYEVGDLEPEVYFTIDTMQVGDISAPFAFSAPNGDQLYRIISLQSRTAPHKANLKQDYSKIKKAAQEEKKNMHMNNWVTDKISGTYFMITPSYESCENLQLWEENRRVTN